MVPTFSSFVIYPGLISSQTYLALVHFVAVLLDQTLRYLTDTLLRFRRQAGTESCIVNIE